MKTAVFGDVHGNLIALERFISETVDLVDEYVCLGDTVNYGPWNDECLKAIHELPHITVLQGNHERLFLQPDNSEHESPLVTDFLHHSRKFFSRPDLIADLPERTQIGPFVCAHTINGSYVYPDTRLVVANNFIIGHSHHQFRIERSGFQIVNPGSIGQNRSWINLVDYMIVDDEARVIELLSVDYDVDLFITELASRGYPDRCISYYAEKPRRVT